MFPLLDANPVFRVVFEVFLALSFWFYLSFTILFLATMIPVFTSLLSGRNHRVIVVLNKIMGAHKRKVMLAGVIRALVIIVAWWDDPGLVVQLVEGMIHLVGSACLPWCFIVVTGTAGFISIRRKVILSVLAWHVILVYAGMVELRWAGTLTCTLLFAIVSWVVLFLMVLDTFQVFPVQARQVTPSIVQLVHPFRMDSLVVLELKSVRRDAGAHDPPGDFLSLDERARRYIDFFTSKWYYLATSFQLRVSFRLLVEGGQYKCYLILVIRSRILYRSNTIERLVARVNAIRTSISHELSMELDMLSGQEMLDTLRSLLPRCRDARSVLVTSGSVAPVRRHVKVKDKFVYLGSIDFSTSLTSFLHQKYRKKLEIDSIITSLVRGKKNVQMFFNMDFTGARIGRISTGEFNTFHEMSEGNNHMRNYDYSLQNVKFGGGFMVASTAVRPLLDDAACCIGLMRGAWEVRFRRGIRWWQVVSAFTGMKTTHESYSLRTQTFFRFFQLPTRLSPQQQKIVNISMGAPPVSKCNLGLLNIGRVLVNDVPMHDYLVKMDDLKKHVFVSGMTGTGKTTFVNRFVEEWRVALSHVPFLIIEIKGEYRARVGSQGDVKVLRPGKDFCFCAFGDGKNPRMHAERLFNILDTSFQFHAYKDFSPQMEKILVDVIYATASQQDPLKRNFNTFFMIAKQYITDNKHLIPFIESSWIGIENRLRKITSGPLHAVFEDQARVIPFEQILASNHVLSLGDLVEQGATKEDIFFVSNMVLKQVFDMNLISGPSLAPRHLTIMEDAQYFERRARGDAGASSSYFEDFALLLRGTGEIFMAVSTRPSISLDVMANAGMIVTFQTRLKEDVNRLQNLLHLDEEKTRLLEILPELTCMIKVNSFPDPFLLTVRDDREGDVDHQVESTIMPAIAGSHVLNLDQDMARRVSTVARMMIEFESINQKIWNRRTTLDTTEHHQLRTMLEKTRQDINAALVNDTTKGIFKKKKKAISTAFSLPISLVDMFLDTS